MVTTSIDSSPQRQHEVNPRLVWSDEKEVPVGTAQEEQAVQELADGLMKNLRDACAELVRRTEE